MQLKNVKRWSVATLFVIAGGCTVAGLLIADELQKQTRTRQIQEEELMRSGTVKEFMKNDHLDTDGIRMDDGTIVHFPPHIGRKVVQTFNVGDTIKVEGRNETRPEGEVVFEVTKIIGASQTIVVDHPSPPLKRTKRHENDTPLNTKGTVKVLVRNHQGDVDGFLLSEETEVKIPPHQGVELIELVHVGDLVRIEGRRHVTPHGDIHLHADRIVVDASGKVFQRDEPGLNKPGPPHHHADFKVETEKVHGPTNVEIMQELREIRLLIEKLR
jgi:hypothetical protein